ncbi:ATP-binding protein [Streptomyces tardus]|uniref:ATP-binding protein n=1 Tax=Streptomyces tardus TaxID=2780544 RepID=UPI001C1FAB2E|nr:ATP-binding protein [Streptomyces tardus]
MPDRAGRQADAGDARPALRGEVRAAAVREVAVRDVRGVRGAELCWPPGDIVILSGLPGGGKSTLLRRFTAPTGPLHLIDSQDVRERLERAVGRMPYALLRPLARVAHYLRLWWVLRLPGAGVAVHDCGQWGWVRRWLGREAARRGGRAHLLLLDVSAQEARAGQWSRSRGVSEGAFDRHVRAMAALHAELSAGRLPVGCSSALLLDRTAAATLRRAAFEKGAHAVGGPPGPSLALPPVDRRPGGPSLPGPRCSRTP